MTLSDNTALLVIDVQQGLDDPQWGEWNNPGAEQNFAKLVVVGLTTDHCVSSTTATVQRTAEVLAEAGSPA